MVRKTTGTFQYSPKEMELISYFGFADIAHLIAPDGIYRMMAEKAFLDGDQSSAAQSLRCCIKAMGNIYRMSPEWDALIEMPIAAQYRQPEWVLRLNSYQRDSLLFVFNLMGYPYGKAVEPFSFLNDGDWVAEIGYMLDDSQTVFPKQEGIAYLREMILAWRR
jgi:hypothetical protein